MFLDFADFLIDPPPPPTISSSVTLDALGVDTLDDLVVFSIKVSDATVLLKSLGEMPMENGK